VKAFLSKIVFTYLNRFIEVIHREVGRAAARGWDSPSAGQSANALAGRSRLPMALRAVPWLL
jgi:hypothetical protein